MLFLFPLCHSERSEDELLRTLSENLYALSLCFQILRDAQDDMTIFIQTGSKSYSKYPPYRCPTSPSSGVSVGSPN